MQSRGQFRCMFTKYDENGNFSSYRVWRPRKWTTAPPVDGRQDWLYLSRVDERQGRRLGVGPDVRNYRAQQGRLQCRFRTPPPSTSNFLHFHLAKYYLGTAFQIGTASRTLGFPKAEPLQEKLLGIIFAENYMKFEIKWTETGTRVPRGSCQPLTPPPISHWYPTTTLSLPTPHIPPPDVSHLQLILFYVAWRKHWPK